MLSRGVSHGPRRRSGFTLAEVITAVALIAVLAAVMLPAVRGRMQDGYEDAIIQEFTSLASAITAFRQDVGSYPQTLDLLTSPRSPFRNICGTTLSATDSAKWNGPYVARTILNVSQYQVASHDFVDNTLFRANTTQIYIVIEGADLTTAKNIDLKIDGTADQNNGTLLYASDANAYDLQYVIPTRSGAC